jgi:hypothetical protein
VVAAAPPLGPTSCLPTEGGAPRARPAATRTSGLEGWAAGLLGVAAWSSADRSAPPRQMRARSPRPTSQPRWTPASWPTTGETEGGRIRTSDANCADSTRGRTDKGGTRARANTDPLTPPCTRKSRALGATTTQRIEGTFETRERGDLCAKSIAKYVVKCCVLVDVECEPASILRYRSCVGS